MRSTNLAWVQKFSYRPAGWFRCATLLVASILSACASTATVLTSDGLVAKDGSPAYEHLKLSFSRADEFQKRISQGLSSASDPVVQTAFQQMATDGFGLVDANCSDFFHQEGRNQQWVLFGRDVVAAFGTIATAVAAATQASSGLTTSLSILTATGYNGLDIYQRNFLFGADNIASTQELVLKAMNTHRTAVLNSKTPWRDFGQAQSAIMRYQEECMPAKILVYSRSAIRNAEFEIARNDGAPDDKQIIVRVAPVSTTTVNSAALKAPGPSSPKPTRIDGIAPKTPLSKDIDDRRHALINYIKAVASHVENGEVAQSELGKIARALKAPTDDNNPGHQVDMLIAFITSSLVGSPEMQRQKMSEISENIAQAGVIRKF